MEFRKCKTKGLLRAGRRGRCWGLETKGPPPQGCSDLTSSQVSPPHPLKFPVSTCGGEGAEGVPEASTGPHLLLIDWGWKKAIAVPTQA